MSHVVAVHALRNAPPTKPHPPWPQQLQDQWQATRQAFGSIRAPDSGSTSTSDSIHDGDKVPKYKSSMESLKAALHETKNALLAVIGLLPHKLRTDLDNSRLMKSFMIVIQQGFKR